MLGWRAEQARSKWRWEIIEQQQQSTKRNIDGRIRATTYVQDSGPPGYKHKNGVFKEKQHSLVICVELRLPRLEYDNQPWKKAWYQAKTVRIWLTGIV